MADTALQARILKHVTVAANGCWIWTGATRMNYGAIKVAGKVLGAHVAAHIAFKGPVSAGAVVMHSCDVRSCVNPEHLSIGTHGDNMRDAQAKSRLPGKSVARVLTDAEINGILDQYDRGLSKRELQNQFDIPATTLTRLLIRKGREQAKEWAK